MGQKRNTSAAYTSAAIPTDPHRVQKGMKFLTTESTEKEDPNSLTGKIIGASIEIHRTLGAGLLESAYEPE